MHQMRSHSEGQVATTPVRLAVVGVCGYAEILIKSFWPFVDNGKARWVAAAVLKQEQQLDLCLRLQTAGATIFTDWQKMIRYAASEADIVLLPVPIHLHRMMAECALDAGLRVFLEKPLAATLQDALYLVNKSVLCGRRMLIGYQDIYEENVQRIKQIILSGKLGRIKYMRGIALWPRDSRYYQRNDWAGRLQLKGAWVFDSPVSNAMAHFINLMLYWAGNSPQCSASVKKVQGSVYRARPIESFDTASLHIDTDAGFPIEFHGTHSCRNEYGPDICVQGERGSIRWSLEKGGIVEIGSTRERLKMPGSFQERCMPARVLAWTQGESIAGAEPEQALEHVKVVHLIHSGMPVHDVDLNHIRVLSGGQIAIHAIENLLMDRFHNGGVLTEKHASWVQNAVSVTFET